MFRGSTRMTFALIFPTFTDSTFRHRFPPGGR